MGHERRWIELGQQRYQTMRGQGLVLIDMDALERSIISGDAGQAFHQMLNHYRSEGAFDGKGMALLQRAITGWILGAGTVEVPDQMADPQPISVTPPADVSLRRSLRVLAMVAELHKAGYQRLRVAAGMSPSGCYWRCHITPADNVGANGWEPRDWESGVATYTSGDEDLYFGWNDAPGKSARQLAQLFLKRFPELAKRGAGRDRPYAGWFVGMLGAAENGRLPIFFADWDLDPVEIEMPPPPIGAMVLRGDDGEDGFIANEKLSATDLPRPDASWEEIERFCITYDGYLGGQRSVDECMQIADRVLTMGLTHAAVDELRTLLFIRQRQARWNSEEPVAGEIVDLARAAIEEIRSRLREEENTSEPTTYEKILEVGAEGGTVGIVGQPVDGGWLFRVRADEAELLAQTDEDAEIATPQRSWCTTWRSVLKQLDAYPWVQLYPLAVHPAFKERVISALRTREKKGATVFWPDWHSALANGEVKGARAD